MLRVMWQRMQDHAVLGIDPEGPPNALTRFICDIRTVNQNLDALRSKSSGICKICLHVEVACTTACYVHRYVLFQHHTKEAMQRSNMMLRL